MKFSIEATPEVGDSFWKNGKQYSIREVMDEETFEQNCFRVVATNNIEYTIRLYVDGSPDSEIECYWYSSDRIY